MKKWPQLRVMPRVPEDFERCMRFVSSYAYGRPLDRARDIFTGIRKIQRHPEANQVQCHRRSTGLKLRRKNAAQFVIIYVYLPPSALFPDGAVSVRAIRHASERNVFCGVRERQVPYGVQ